MTDRSHFTTLLGSVKSPHSAALFIDFPALGSLEKVVEYLFKDPNRFYQGISKFNIDVKALQPFSGSLCLDGVFVNIGAFAVGGLNRGCILLVDHIH